MMTDDEKSELTVSVLKSKNESELLDDDAAAGALARATRSTLEMNFIIRK